MEPYGGMEVKIHAFLFSAPVGGEWSATQFDRFNPREKFPRFPWDSNLGGPKNRSRRREEKKNLLRTGARSPTPRPHSI